MRKLWGACDGATALSSVVLAWFALTGLAALAAVGHSAQDVIATRTNSDEIRPKLGSNQQAGVLRAIKTLGTNFEPPLDGHVLGPVRRSSETRANGVPRRFVVPSGARDVFGNELDKVASGLMEGDPLADAVIAAYDGRARELYQHVSQALESGRTPDDAAPELAALLEFHKQVPDWVDFDQLKRGGEVMVRGGAHGLSSLFFNSLAGPYMSPSGIRPLLRTGELANVESVYPRLMTTLDYVNNVCAEGGLCTGAKGWQQALYVRLGHANVRAQLLDDGFDIDAHGIPINQSDMAGTALAFSVGYLDAMRRMGFRYSARDSKAVMALWRYAAYLNGVDPARLIADEATGRHVAAAIMSTQAMPSQASKDMIDVLTGLRGILPELSDSLGPLKRYFDRNLQSTTASVMRLFLGKPHADAVDLADGLTWHLATALRVSGQAFDRSNRLPGADAVAIRAGRRIWQEVPKRALAELDPAQGTPGHKGMSYRAHGR